MKRIWKLVISYIKFHKKRTLRTVISVALAIIVFISVVNLIIAGNLVTRAVEEERNGSWQVKFWNISKEQSEQIARLMQPKLTGENDAPWGC